MTDTFPHSDLIVSETQEQLRIDLVKEELDVHAEIVETAKVEITKRVVTEEASVTLQHLEHTVNVERIAIGKIFDTAPPATRQLDDGTVVYSIVREVPVVVTRFELVEEVHVRMQHTAHDEHYVLPVRHERLDINRIPNPTKLTAAAVKPLTKS